ncbi:MAG: hypothetical protein LCH54_03420 [Bacteroidetes bacterium]|nr:hypothetical protein [Bacteroidota bacterium]
MLKTTQTLLLFSFLSFIFLKNSSAQSDIGLPDIRNYGSQDLRASSQVWTGAAGAFDLVYFGTKGVLLEFDGMSWKSYPTPDLRTVRSIAVDSSGKIWWGTSNNFGYIGTDSVFNPVFSSLFSKISEDKRKFGNVTSIIPTQNGVYFRSGRFIFRYFNDQVYKIEKSRSIDALSLVDGQIYGSVDQNGLFILKDTTSTSLPGTIEISKDYVPSILPYSADTLLLVTEQNGLLLYGLETFKLTSLPDGKYPPMLSGRIYGGRKLSNGHFIIWTLAAGLFEFNGKGRFIRRFTEKEGLVSDNVKFVFEDKNQNLWVTTESGISYIEYQSPFSFFDKRNGLKGIVHSIARHDGMLYVGTGDGLYKLSQGTDKNGGNASLEFIPGIQAQVFGMLSTGNELLASTGDGIFQIKPEFRKINPARSSVLYQVPGKTDLLILGYQKGTALISKKNGRWSSFTAVKGTDDVRSISGGSGTRFWLGSHSNGLYRLDLSILGSDTTSNVSKADTTFKFNTGQIFTGMVSDWPVFSLQDGLFYPDPETSSPVPLNSKWPELNMQFEKTGLFHQGKDGSLLIATSDGSGFSENLALFFPSREKKWENRPGSLQRLRGYSYTCFFSESDGTIWAGTQDGLIRIDKLNSKTELKSGGTNIREIKTGHGTVIFSGKNGSIWQKKPPLISWNENSLHFQFARNTFTTDLKSVFRYKLEGQNELWSAWQEQPFCSFTNLWPGSYTLLVQGKSEGGEASAPDSFQFEIATPWYLKWYFLIFCAGLTGFFVYLIIRLKTQRLQKQNDTLEAKVLEKSKELLVSEKMAAVGQISGGLAHEINNGLAIINANLHLIQMNLNSDSGFPGEKLKLEELNDIRQAINGANLGSERIQDIVESMKKAANPHQMERTFIQVDATIRTVISYYLKPDTGTKIEFLPGEPPRFICNPGLFSLAIYNLLKNSVDAVQSLKKQLTTESFSGNVQVETKYVQGKEPALVVIIADNGNGIPGHLQSKIFDPFFTTKEVGSGRGLGLYEVYSIISGMGGKIKVESNEGTGTRFVLEIPYSNLKNDQK